MLYLLYNYLYIKICIRIYKLYNEDTSKQGEIKMETLDLQQSEIDQTAETATKICFYCKRQILKKPLVLNDKFYCDDICKHGHESSCECFL